ncbi:V-type proton ATPase subunit E [bacterium]|nr:V-type proton ATPase subunit E [bacterium]
MAGSNGLLESIEKAAEKEKEQIILDAEKSAAEILAKADAESKKILDDFQNEKDILLLTEASRIKNKARREIQEKLFNLKSNIIEECFSLVLKEIEEIRKDRKQYKKVLKTLLDESLIGFDESKKIVVIISKKDEQVFEEILRNQQGKKQKVETSGEFTGGVVIMENDGKKVVYNTFESRLERLKRQQTSLLTKELF